MPDGGITGQILSVAVGADGRVYVGGRFDNAAGIAEADRVAVWDPATGTWSALGSNGSGDGALNGVVYALAIAPDGKVYMGGAFINAGNNPLADFVTVYLPEYLVFVPAISR